MLRLFKMNEIVDFKMILLDINFEIMFELFLSFKMKFLFFNIEK